MNGKKYLVTYILIEMDQEYKLLESQVRSTYGRVIYSHKTHEKCADILNDQAKTFKITEICLSALTTSSILAVILMEEQLIEIAAAIISTILLFLNLYAKEFNLLAIGERHTNTALVLLEIRDQILSLLIDIRIAKKNLNELMIERDGLNQKLVDTYKGAPRTNSKAYNKASQALKENEEFTFSDAELNDFLPDYLKNNENP